MKKMDFKTSIEEAEAYVREIQSDPLLKDFEVTLHNVNDFALYLKEKKNCQVCNGLSSCFNESKGYATIIEEGGFLLERCPYKKVEDEKSSKQSLLNTLFVSKAILNADLSNFELITENRKKIHKYIVEFISSMREKKFVKGLYISGDFSTGKTFILGCIANELAKNGIKSLVIYFPDLVGELKSAIGTPRLEELINYLKSVDVLLIDDFGSEVMTPWLRDEILGSILNYRLMEEKPIFISSNLDCTSEEFINHLSITRAPGEKLKAERIKTRINGLAKNIFLDNKAYFR